MTLQGLAPAQTVCPLCHSQLVILSVRNLVPRRRVDGHLEIGKMGSPKGLVSQRLWLQPHMAEVWTVLQEPTETVL